MLVLMLVTLKTDLYLQKQVFLQMTVSNIRIVCVWRGWEWGENKRDTECMRNRERERECDCMEEKRKVLPSIQKLHTRR